MCLPGDRCADSWLADANERQWRRLPEHGDDEQHGQAGGWQQRHGEPAGGGATDGLGLANSNGREAWRETASTLGHRGAANPAGGGPWADIYYHACRDGKARPVPVEPGLFPLADGVPARVGRLRGYGNAIVPQVAAAFIRSVMDVL